VLRDIRAEQVEETDRSLIQAILESATRDTHVLDAMAEELRAFPWAQAVEWTETGAEAE
jgi:putative Mg2+ transporter-C (MgtC) family protein